MDETNKLEAAYKWLDFAVLLAEWPQEIHTIADIYTVCQDMHDHKHEHLANAKQIVAEQPRRRKEIRERYRQMIRSIRFVLFESDTQHVQSLLLAVRAIRSIGRWAGEAA